MNALDTSCTAQPIRLNIGAGDTVIPGFTAIDRRFGTEAYPLNYPDNSVDEIRCVHMLEHLSFKQALEALEEWRRVLKPGGRIRLSVPDVSKVVALAGKDPRWAFYLMGGQTDENDFHKSAFDEERLRAYLEKFDFAEIRHWTSENTDLASFDAINLNLEAIKPLVDSPKTQAIKLRAIMGLPRVGWNDAWLSITEALHPLHIPIETHTGCFWGQNMQKGMERAMADGIDWLITLDYDSMILPKHIDTLIDWMAKRPDIDALASLQMRRGAETPLFGLTGKTSADVTPEPIKVDSAHFGLTILRVDCLRTMPKPWLIAKADEHGEWGDGRRDDDITFWDKWKEAGHSVYVAPDVRIGHLELLVSEFDDEFKPRHRHIGDWWNHHARQGHCARSKKEI